VGVPLTSGFFAFFFCFRRSGAGPRLVLKRFFLAANTTRFPVLSPPSRTPPSNPQRCRLPLFSGEVITLSTQPLSFPISFFGLKDLKSCSGFFAKVPTQPPLPLVFTGIGDPPLPSFHATQQPPFFFNQVGVMIRSSSPVPDFLPFCRAVHIWETSNQSVTTLFLVDGPFGFLLGYTRAFPQPTPHPSSSLFFFPHLEPPGGLRCLVFPPRNHFDVFSEQTRQTSFLFALLFFAEFFLWDRSGIFT